MSVSLSKRLRPIDRVADRELSALVRSQDLVQCTDGFRRPIGPRLRTLADGAPASVESLRGYGNTLNAETAMAFAVTVREPLKELVLSQREARAAGSSD
jgi:hypothetical protein